MIMHTVVYSPMELMFPLVARRPGSQERKNPSRLFKEGLSHRGCLQQRDCLVVQPEPGALSLLISGQRDEV